jgi:hypothetical protein
MWADQSMDATTADAAGRRDGVEAARSTMAPALGGTPGLVNRSSVSAVSGGTAVYPQYGTRTSIDALTDLHAEAQLGGASLNTPSRYNGDAANQWALSTSSVEEGDRVWNRWVVVFGFAADPRGLNTILRKFQEFGEIETYRVSNGNYLFLR